MKVLEHGLYIGVRIRESEYDLWVFHPKVPGALGVRPKENGGSGHRPAGPLRKRFVVICTHGVARPTL